MSLGNFITDESIPSLSTLYQEGKLAISTLSKSDHAYAANVHFNEIVCLIQADITQLQVTSIVNAANAALKGGGGVDGAIHHAAGPQLLQACQELGGCATGFAKMTSGFKLPSENVIHAVGPIYQSDKDPEASLRSCYRHSLELAVQKGGTLAFSCISTGVYSYPSDKAARIACEEVRSHLERDQKPGERQQACKTSSASLGKIVFCVYGNKDMKAYLSWLPIIFPPVAISGEQEKGHVSSLNPMSQCHEQTTESESSLSATNRLSKDW